LDFGDESARDREERKEKRRGERYHNHNFENEKGNL
jgi:hypothetical protein